MGLGKFRRKKAVAVVLLSCKLS